MNLRVYRRFSRALAPLLLLLLVACPWRVFAQSDPLLEPGGQEENAMAILASQAEEGSVNSRADAIWKLAQVEDSAGTLAGLLNTAEPATRPYLAMALG